MKKKNITLRILIGLPGSGKTCFAKSLANQGAAGRGIYVFGENEVRDSDWRIFKVDSGKRFAPMDSAELQRSINLYASGLFRTLVMDGLFLTTERVMEIIENVSAKFNLTKVILDYWAENKKECLRNDYLRRRIGSSLSIESLSVKVDLKAIQEAYPQTVVERHTVYHTPDWVLFFREYISLSDETRLCSDEWVTGGETWNYEGDHSPVDGDEIPKEFQELDDLLKEICPNITHLQYKEISSDCVMVAEREDSDYYSCLTKQRFVCDLEKLYGKLCDFGYIPSSSDPLEVPAEMKYEAIARELSEFTVWGLEIHPDICDKGASAIRALLAENARLRRSKGTEA